LFSLVVCFELAVFSCVSLSSAAFAKEDFWMGCRGPDLDARIVSCSRLIDGGRRETKSNQITAYMNRGAAYRAKGDFDRALADLDKALKLYPKLARALMERASIHHAKGEFDRAIADYDAAISGQSQSPAAFYGRGEAYRAKNDFDRAIADYDEAIRFNPNDANAFLSRANAYRAKHDLDQTKQDLEAALRLEPQLATAKDLLDEVSELITNSAAPPTAAAPTAASAPAIAPAIVVSPMLLVLLALVALIGLFAIIFINFRSKPVDKPHLSGTEQHARARDGYLAEVSRLQPGEACSRAGTSLEGLSQTEADARLKKFGLNLIASETKATILQELWSRARNPLNALLLSLATVSYLSGDVRAAVVITSMVVLAITTAFIQEHRSNEAAAKLRAMVHTTASVRRTPCDADNPFSEIPIEQLVPGDIVRLSAGDIIPAELRLLEAKDLFINQSTLTGEAMPAEKYAHARDGDCDDPFDLPNICFMGANVVSGYGTGVILRTGPKTFLASLLARSPGDACRPPSIRASTDSPG
jgi:tetratricopeptide (TPR) repeat protein